ncbi:MAG: hypothetical protein ACXABO_11945 [Promethearchaeota archaeon]|jgi:hypothetical protein
MKKKKLSLIILLIGIILLVSAPILGYTLDKIEILNKRGINIEEDSTFGIESAYDYPISLQEGQKIVIEFSVFYANVSATLIILGKGLYDQQLALNSSPTIISGQYFVYSQFAWGQSPYLYTSSTNSITISNNGYWYIEFAGGTGGDYIISIPGKYVIVIYGDNSGPPIDTSVRFNLKIRIDGPGDFLEELFYYLGTGVMVGLVLLVAYDYYKKLRRGI